MFSMSLYSIGKNELKGLIEKEKIINRELKTVESMKSLSDVIRFKSALLKNEATRIHNKIKLLSSEGSGDIA
ncbi:MAG: hypothetical protein LBL32_03590 [Holosporales bacterium]|jgi:hypothetical protein|nr:hypothetical protein [Holosporales bacterium]